MKVQAGSMPSRGSKKARQTAARKRVQESPAVLQQQRQEGEVMFVHDASEYAL